jgi:uncharacterized protein
MAIAPIEAAIASEFDVLAEEEPKVGERRRSPFPAAAAALYPAWHFRAPARLVRVHFTLYVRVSRSLLNLAPSSLCLCPLQQNGYIIDDAGVLSKSAQGEVNGKLADLEKRLGYKLTVVTLRKLEYDPDAFSFSEKVFKKWHKTDGGDNAGILLVVTTGKDGAVVGGSKFLGALGDDLIDSVVGDNIPVFTEQEKYNETVTSSLNRLVAKLDGKQDPGAPERAGGERKRTYKTKEETARTKTVTATVVGTLLLIVFVVPMLQFYGYVGGRGN